MFDVNVDLMNGNSGVGEVANSLMTNGRLDIGMMRPFYDIDPEDGKLKTFVTVCTGNPKIPANYKTFPIQTNGTLRRDEWKALDEAVMTVARERLVGINDLVSRGLVYNLGNPMGTTILEWHDVGESMEAVITMDGVTRGKGDRPVFKYNYIPIPIIHVDYEINARVLAASRNMGNPLDVTSAEHAARRVAEKLEDMDSLINLTFNLHCYALISDFSDISAVGQRYELCRRTSIPMDEMKNTDFESMGKKLLSGGKGAITTYGVLYHTGNTPEQIYNGEQFPEYHWRSDDVATITLESGDYHSGIKYEYLYLPCWETEIEKAVNRLGLSSPESCATHLDFGGMSEQVYQIFTEDYPLSDHLYTLNNLARSYTGFDEQAREDFHAIIEMAQPKAPEDVVMLADNFYEFTVVPGVKTSADYGRYMIIDSGRYDFDENLKEYIDFGGYGEHRIQNENGSFTDYGYIAYHGCTTAVEELLRQNDSQGMQMGGMQL